MSPVAGNNAAPKDTGWAWMTVVAGFIMHFLVVGGAAKSFGILYVELIEKFQTSSSATMSIVAMSQSLCMLLGPIANALSLRFTSRRIVMLGGLLMTTGFLLSTFPPNIAYLYFSYGLLVGVGSSLAYSPTIVTVGQYFARRRALANGLSVAGSGLGNFAVPPMIRAALDRYGFAGTLLIMGGLMLNVCLAGALLRPLSSYRERRPVVTGGHEKDDAHEFTRAVKQEANNDVTLAGDGARLDIATEQEIKVERTSGCCRSTKPLSSRLARCCVNVLDWSLLTNTVFLVYAFGAMLIFTGYPQVYVMLPAHASRSSIGASKSGAAFLVSILGLMDVVGRIGFGLLADFNVVPKRFLFAGCMSISGTLICVLPHIGNYIGLAIMCGVIGLFIGAFFTLLMVVLAEKLGVNRLHSAFGLVATFMGCSFFYSAPIVGSLRDYTGSWSASFTFCGVSMLCGTAVLLLDPIAVRYEQKRQRRRETIVSESNV